MVTLVTPQGLDRAWGITVVTSAYGDSSGPGDSGDSAGFGQ